MLHSKYRPNKPPLLSGCAASVVAALTLAAVLALAIASVEHMLGRSRRTRTLPNRYKSTDWWKH